MTLEGKGKIIFDHVIYIIMGILAREKVEAFVTAFITLHTRERERVQKAQIGSKGSVSDLGGLTFYFWI